jgi:hypothetical protein
MTQDEAIALAKQAGFTEESFAFQRHKFLAFAKLVAAKYEDEIQDLKDMIIELQECQE